MRKYDKEFKEEAVKLSDEIGIKQAAAQLGVAYYTLSEWRQKRTRKDGVDLPVLETPVRDDNLMWRKF